MPSAAVHRFVATYVRFEPVRSLAALLAFGQAVLTLLALQLGWGEDTVLAVGGVWVAFCALLGSFAVRDAVTPTAKVGATNTDPQEV